MAQESVSQQLKFVITEGRRDRGSFFGSILAGTLLGLGVDRLFDTAPTFVIVGVLLGAYAASKFAVEALSELRLRKDADGQVTQDTLASVAFVPLLSGLVD